MGRWAGIDYGHRTIGLALSDAGESIAFPAGTLPGSGRTSTDADRVAAWTHANEAAGIVVGLPLNMDGTDSAQTRIARAFASELQQHTDLPIELWDERLTTFEANSVMAASGLPRRRRERLRDTLAARVMLQSFLDARRGRPDAT